MMDVLNWVSDHWLLSTIDLLIVTGAARGLALGAIALAARGRK
jgi:hypothetical protein